MAGDPVQLVEPGHGAGVEAVGEDLDVFWVGAVLLGRVEGLRLLVTKKPMPRSIHQVRAATHLA